MERHVKKYPSKWQNQYTEEFKQHVCEDYLKSTLSAKETERKYSLGNSRLASWLKQFGFEHKRQVSLPLVIMPEKLKPDQQ